MNTIIFKISEGWCYAHRHDDMNLQYNLYKENNGRDEKIQTEILWIWLWYDLLNWFDGHRSKKDFSPPFLIKLTFFQVVDNLRETFLKGKTLPYEFRLNQLKNLQRLLEENAEDIDRALHKDLRRHKMECMYWRYKSWYWHDVN